MSDGRKIPVLGYGTYLVSKNIRVPISSELLIPFKVPKDQMKTNILTALQTGYRSIDCAFFYDNEDAVGEALAEAMDKLKVKREDIFVTSKVWPTHMRPENVRKSCEQSLKDLRLAYLDLYLIHWPVAFQPSESHFPMAEDGETYALDSVPLLDTWRAMEKLVDDGLVKSIGISNFNRRQIDHILNNCRIKPVNLQIEIHANFPNEKLVNYAHSRGLTVSAFSPLRFLRGTSGETNLLEQPWMKTIAERHKKTPAQVLLRYLIQRHIVVQPKSSMPSRIKENAQIFDFTLSDEEMKILNTKGVNKRQVTSLGMRYHPEYPFYDEY
ncbi:Dihydroxyacetone reductase [Fasciolopsis buskii]|uniref:Dihydroxyacetone reductase n=1 Tax=Fasciolopsis buskii TaxID=27845 RepID=A0A8E0S0V1_9TREM|nr:Dihydroxyacetone reductase [Fasciolopsis buski]